MRFLWDPNPDKKFLKNLTSIQCHFSFLAVAEDCVVIVDGIFYVKILLNFGCSDGSLCLDRRRIFNFFNFGTRPRIRI